MLLGSLALSQKGLAEKTINLSPNPYAWAEKGEEGFLKYHGLEGKPIGYFFDDNLEEQFNSRGQFVPGFNVWGDITDLKLGKNEVSYFAVKDMKDFQGEVRVKVNPNRYNIEVEHYGGLINMQVARNNGLVYNMTFTKDGQKIDLTERQRREMGVLGDNIWAITGKNSGERIKIGLYPKSFRNSSL